jgi:amino acid adenylation domain-containing protein
MSPIETVGLGTAAAGAPTLQELVGAGSDLPAVRHGGRVLSYPDLHAKAAAVAAEVVGRGMAAETPIGVCTSDPIEFVPAVLGILRAGCPYVPLDPSWPAARYGRVAERIGMPFALTGRESAQRLLAEGLAVGRLDELRPDTAGAAEGRQGSLAYMILTSGSTGEPKAVAVEHASARESVLARRQVYGGRVRRFLWHSPPAFDSSVAGLFWTLADGGTLVVPEAEERTDPRRLLDLIRTERVSHVLCLPRVWREILALAAPGDLDGVRVTITAGEPLTGPVVAAHGKLCATPLWNEYGPAEGSVWATVHRCDPHDDTDVVPIGRARPGSDVLLMGEDLTPCGVGETGEIWLTGRAVARGYAGAPAQTAERFVPVAGGRAYRTGDLAVRRPDGALEFRGRRDDQVKVAGIRVELAEVERALLAVDGVLDAAVLAHEVGEDRTAIAAFVVGLAAEDVRTQVAAHLPAPMIPATVVELPELPRNSNGKIDRTGLTALLSTGDPDAGGGERFDEPLHTVIEVWRTVLRNQRLGPDADLFASGGDSISAVLICAGLGGHGVTVSPRDVFEARTPLRLAELIAAEDRPLDEEPSSDAAAPVPAGPPPVPRREPATVTFTDQPIPLTPIQRWLVDGGAPGHWNFSVGLTVERGQADKVRAALAEVVDRHPMLSAAFEPAPRSADWRVRPGRGAVPMVIEFLDDAALRGDRIAYWQRTLDLRHGPVARLLWFEAPGTRPHVVLVAHHMVFDAVSWRIVMADLGNALRAPLPPRGSYGLPDWVADHHRAIQKGAYDAELGHWLTTARRAAGTRLGIDPGTEGGAVRSVHRLPAVSASTEVLLGAVAMAFHRVFPELPWLGVDLETHGRAAASAGAGEVGWFTSFHPVAVALDAVSAPEEAVAAARDAVAGVPGAGDGYLALAHARDGLAGVAELRTLPPPLLGLNHLGRLERSVPVGDARLTVDLESPMQRAPSARRRHAFDLDCVLVEGALVALWTAPGPAGDHLTRLAQEFTACLEAGHEPA